MPGEPLCNRFAYANGNGYRNGNGDGCSISNCYRNCYSDTNAYCIANTENYAYTTASSHRAAASIDCEADFKDSNGNSRAKLASSPLADRPHDLLWEARHGESVLWRTCRLRKLKRRSRYRCLYNKRSANTKDAEKSLISRCALGYRDGPCPSALKQLQNSVDSLSPIRVEGHSTLGIEGF